MPSIAGLNATTIINAINANQTNLWLEIVYHNET